jgi:hypothetical protein
MLMLKKTHSAVTTSVIVALREIRIVTRVRLMWVRNPPTLLNCILDFGPAKNAGRRPTNRACEIAPCVLGCIRTMRGEGADSRPAGFSSPIARQFAAPPMRVFARWIENPLDVTIDRLQRGDAREFDRAVVFGRLRQKVGRRQDFRHVAFGFGDDLGEVVCTEI